MTFYFMSIKVNEWMTRSCEMWIRNSWRGYLEYFCSTYNSSISWKHLKPKPVFIIGIYKYIIGMYNCYAGQYFRVGQIRQDREWNIYFFTQCKSNFCTQFLPGPEWDVGSSLLLDYGTNFGWWFQFSIAVALNFFLALRAT